MARYLTFLTRGKHFALPVERVKEILAISGISELPSGNPCLRGGITVRGGVLPLFDFRTMIGAPLLLKEREELVTILNQREQDHIDWIDALTKSVNEGTEFRKATDPHACAFGKWYYSYKAPDSSIERTLASFEQPHNEIHALAQKALAMGRSQGTEQALKVIETARHSVLGKLLRLFGDLKKALVTDIRELAIICAASNGALFAIAVDGVESIRDLERDNFQAREGLQATPLISKIWSTNAQTILEVEFGFLDGLLTSSSTCPSAIDELPN